MSKSPRRHRDDRFSESPSPGGLAYAGQQLAVRSFRNPPPSPPGLMALLGLACSSLSVSNSSTASTTTANAVATVIYTHSLEPHVAVVWSACGTSSASSLPPARSPSPSSRCCRRAHPPGRQGRWLRYGLLPPHRRHHLEPQHLVVRPARIQFPHPHRLHHRVGIANQLMNPHTGTSGVDWEQARRRLQSSADFSAGWIRLRRDPPAHPQTLRQKQGSVRVAERHRAAALSGFARSSSSPVPASASVTVPTTARRAWAHHAHSSSAPSPPPTPSTTPSF